MFPVKYKYKCKCLNVLLQWQFYDLLENIWVGCNIIIIIILCKSWPGFSTHIGKCVFPRSQSGRDPMIDFTCFDGISHHHHHHLIEPLSSSSSSSSSSSRSSMWAAEIWWWIEVVLPQPLWPNYFLQTPMMRVIGCCWRWFVMRWSDHCGNGDWFLDEIDQYVSLGT